LDRALYKFLEQTVAGHMTRAVRTVTRGHTVRDLSEMFERDDFNSYPVEEDAQVIGIVTKFDLLKCFVFTPSQMVPPYEQLMSRTVGDVMTSEFIYVRTDTKLTRVLQLMVDHRVRSVPAIDDNNRLVGIIARRDVLKALADSARGE
jgi:CBS domain-containing protein